MIYFDITKTGSAKHSSGLTRVSRRLLAELNPYKSVTPVIWKNGNWRNADTKREIAFSPTRNEWLFTAELFSEEERPGFRAFIATRPCKLAAVFHDAIPLRFPEITLAHSVERAPDYMKMLASFDRVFAVSDHSGDDLAGFWKWLGVTPLAKIERITHGADFMPFVPRVTAPPATVPKKPALLCVGILGPRKNQSFLLDVCEALWNDGLAFDMHLLGRLDTEFGAPVKDKIKLLRKKHRGLHFHEGAPDKTMLELYAASRAAVFPTIAEGCGLPPLEALWMGLPCACSDLPVLREYTNRGGCVTAPVNHFLVWQAVLRRLLTDDAELARLRTEAMARPLPTWADAAANLRRALA